MKTITTQDKINLLADVLVQREHEVFHYQINIDNYALLLADLPQGDPSGTLTPQRAADFQFRDQVRGLLQSERVEQSKAQRVYDVVLAQLTELCGEGLKNTLIAAAGRRKA